MRNQIVKKIQFRPYFDRTIEELSLVWHRKVRLDLLPSTCKIMFFLEINFLSVITIHHVTSHLVTYANLYKLITQNNAEINKVCKWFHCNQPTIIFSEPNRIIIRRRHQIPPETPPINVVHIPCCTFSGVYIY